MSDDLAAFLAARYDEAEALAVEAARYHGKDWHAGSKVNPVEGTVDVFDDDGANLVAMWVMPGDAAHIAATDPRQRLADIALKRAILAEHPANPFWGNTPPPRRDRTPENVVAWFCDCQSEDGMIAGEYPCRTVRLLGTEFSGHPEYKAGWAP